MGVTGIELSDLVCLNIIYYKYSELLYFLGLLFMTLNSRNDNRVV